jgi:hypothetical protein
VEQGRTTVPEAGSPPESLPLEHYAAIVAAMGDEHPLAEVLGLEGVTLATWARADASHKARLAHDPEAFEAFVRALGDAEDRATRAVRPLSDDASAWVVFLAAFEREGATLLPSLGLTMNDLSRLGREWDRRVARDDKLASRLAELRAELKKSGARPPIPRLVLGPRALLPSPFARAGASPRRAPEPRPEELEVASLDLASYARIAAELLERPRERGSVLLEHRIADGAFAALEARWLARFAADAQALRDFRTLREHERTRLRGVVRQRHDTAARLERELAGQRVGEAGLAVPALGEPAHHEAPLRAPPHHEPPSPRGEPQVALGVARSLARGAPLDEEGTRVGLVPTLLAREVLPFGARGPALDTEPAPPPDPHEPFDPRATSALPSALSALSALRPALPFGAGPVEAPEHDLGQTAELPIEPGIVDEPTAPDPEVLAHDVEPGDAHELDGALYAEPTEDGPLDHEDDDDLGVTAPLPSAARLVELGILRLPETVTAPRGDESTAVLDLASLAPSSPSPTSAASAVGGDVEVATTALLELAALGTPASAAPREPGAVTGTMVLDPSLVGPPRADDVLASTRERAAPDEPSRPVELDVVRVSTVGLSLARYAMLRAELGRAPERRAEILSQYALDDGALDALEASFIERFDAEPKLYADYRTLFERYRMWLAGK